MTCGARTPLTVRSGYAYAQTIMAMDQFLHERSARPSCHLLRTTPALTRVCVRPANRPQLPERWRARCACNHAES